MAYTGVERRKHPRIRANFIVSYRVLEDQDNVDTSQTKNLSLGGMLVTTNRCFEKGTTLALKIRLPFDLSPIEVVGKVVESCEIVKDLIYDTRIEFSSINQRHQGVMSQTVDYYLKKKGKS